ncbi:MAG TPA: FecR domain-containing protein [Puia sp.]|nr:FecR domain-containing protein [Puia sp.]
MGQEQKDYTWNLVAKVLAGEATESELGELEQLLRSNPDLHYPLQIITSLWQTGGPEEQKKAEEAFARHLDRMGALSLEFEPSGDPLMMEPDPIVMDPAGSNRRGPGRWFLVGASAVIALTFSGYFLYRQSVSKAPAPAIPAAQPGEVATRNGSRTSLYLPDGTHVWLNAGSKISYNKSFGAASREVDLTGEAYFDVARNPASPFIIHTSRIDIRVLGTSFNVKSYPADKTTETVLIHGSIEVAVHNKANEKIILKPNEKLVVGNDENNTQRRHPVTIATAQQEEAVVSIQRPTYERTTGTIVETSWVRGQLAFQDEDFGTLAKDMERWYGVTIRFTDPKQMTWRFTGTFEKETIREALDAMKLTTNFNYTIQENQIEITTNK